MVTSVKTKVMDIKEMVKADMAMVNTAIKAIKAIMAKVIKAIKAFKARPLSRGSRS